MFARRVPFARRGVLVVTLITMLAGCALLPEEPAPRPVASAGRLASAERLFLVNVAAKAMYEVEVSRLASRRAVDPRVRSYADGIVAHQEQASAELVALMSAKGVPPPRQL